VNKYFRVVEAQGRGSLHVHMLLWLKDAPNADEMLELLMLSLFWEKVATYLDHNISTHLNGFNEEYVKNHKQEPHILFYRPLDPHTENWKANVRVME
jgi:hypothetical protein